jgi:hypothetical protein
VSGGLFDLINDPVFMAGLEERRRIAATLADRWGCSLASAYRHSRAPGQASRTASAKARNQISMGPDGETT